VLSNKRLKERFGYTPKRTTREVFEYYLKERQRLEQGLCTRAKIPTSRAG